MVKFTEKTIRELICSLRDEKFYKSKFFYLVQQKNLKKYIIIGLLNTLSGYLVGVSIFSLFYKEFGIFFVSVFSNIISILISFINYKIFFFNKSFENILSEFIKFNLIYFLLFLLSIIQLYLYIETFFMHIYIAQGLIILINLIILAISHFYLIFNKDTY